MRPLSAELQTTINIPRGEEPITLVEIDWASGTGYYADKDYTYTEGAVPQAYQGRLESVDAVTTSAKVNSIGNISLSGLKLIDHDGVIKGIYNTNTIGGTPIRVYQTFAGLSSRVTIIEGKIDGNIVWSSIERSLSVGIISDNLSIDIGYTHYEGGPVWPIVFGDCIRVPAVELNPNYQGTLGENVDYSDSSFVVNSGENFPQGVSITITIQTDEGIGIRFVGTMAGNVFTPTLKNAPYYTDLALAARPLGDPDLSDATVIWLADTGISLVGMYCYVDEPTLIPALEVSNYCYKQEGTKCWFKKVWGNDVTLDDERLLGDGVTIKEVCPQPSLRWPSPFLWTWYIDVVGGVPVDAYGGVGSPSDDWLLKSGTKVQYGDLSVKYVANAAISNAIVEVMAYRTVEGERKLQPVPTSYFSISLTDPTTLDATTIYTPQRLSYRIGEDWEDQLYVSVRSWLSGNVSHVLQHLINTYSTLTPDSTSFDAVAIAVDPYPANFAILERQELMSYINDIAYQARCALLQRGDEIVIKYLSVPEAATLTYDTSNVIDKSLKCLLTDSVNLTTVFETEYNPDYSNEDSYTLRFTNNVALYGKEVREVTYFIYNNDRLVRQSLGFWGIRDSNSWRIVNFQSLLNTLSVEGFDTNAIDIPLFSPLSVRGTIESISTDTLTGLTSVVMQLASSDGTNSSGNISETLEYWTGDPAYPISNYDVAPSDPLSGRALTDYVITPDVPEDPVSESALETARAVIVFDVVPDETDWDVYFQVILRAYDAAGNTVNLTGNVTIDLYSSNPDAYLLSNQVYMNQGVWMGPLRVTGSTGTASISLIARQGPGYSGEASAAIAVEPDGAARLVSVPSLIFRDSPFAVTIDKGTPNGSVTVTLNITGSDKIYNDATDILVTSVTLDSGGGYIGNWYIDDGTAGNVVGSITLTDAGNVSTTSEFTVVNSLDNIAYLNKKQSFTKPQFNPKLNQATSAGTKVLNLDDANNFYFTLNADTVVTFTNASLHIGQTGTIQIYSSTSTREVAWATSTVATDAGESINKDIPAGYALYTYDVLTTGKVFVTLTGEAIS